MDYKYILLNENLPFLVIYLLLFICKDEYFTSIKHLICLKKVNIYVSKAKNLMVWLKVLAFDYLLFFLENFIII
jgi:hypothetical protein